MYVNTVKEKTFLGMVYLFWETKVAVVRTSVFFFKIDYVQQHHSKGLGESFPLMWLNMVYLEKLPKCVSPPLWFLTSGVATGGLGGARAPPTQILAPVGIAQNRGDKNIYMGGSLGSDIFDCRLCNVTT